MRRIAVAPTTLSNRVTPRDLRCLADAARRLGLRLHSHLAETADDDAYCRATHGMSLIDVCDETGWLGDDAWFAHMVHLDAAGIRRLGAANVGLSHCPQSNARLGGGIAEVEALEAAGVTISIGVDGAASNESANMLSELHFAWLVHRTRARRTNRGALLAPSDVDLVRWATAGGADVLGLRTGRLRAGYPADISVFRLNGIAHLGMHDPAAGFLASATNAVVVMSLCAGRVICECGEVPGLDLGELRAQAVAATRRIASAAPLA